MRNNNETYKTNGLVSFKGILLSIFALILINIRRIFLAPEKPKQVTGSYDSDPTVLQVSWVQPLPRPGTTTYTVRVYEEKDDNSDFNLKENFGKIITGIVFE